MSDQTTKQISTGKKIARYILSKNELGAVIPLLMLCVIVAFINPRFFIDQFDLFEQARLRRSLKDQQQQIEYYEKEVSQSKQYLQDLQTDTATMEKVAREQYLMKRDNEVVYLIETQE